MFVIKLTYQKPINEVEAHLAAHREYLDTHYATGTFIASGRQEPRIGGLILARAANKEVLQKVVETDPFYVNQIAKYDIIEFTPTKYALGFEKFI